MSPKTLLSVYTYTDYRLYLKDYFASRIAEGSSFSYRELAKEFGFPSPNYVKLVIDAKRNLGLKSVDRICAGLKLREREKEYFSYLVFFCQATATVEKNFYFGLLTSLRIPVTAGTLTPNEYRYYNEWYNCVVRELIVREKTPIDYSCIVSRIRSHVTVSQVKKSVDLLMELGLIEKNVDGSFKQTSRLISTDREVTSLGIRNYHAKMIDMGKGSIDEVTRDKREISSLTVSVSDECMQKIKTRIQDFEDEILGMVQADCGARNVYQANFQFFPLTQEEKDA